MIKEEFIARAKLFLKQQGFKKKNNYWYRKNGSLLYCVVVLGSQWAEEDYYVEIGFAIPDEVGTTPSLTNWHIRKRCASIDGNRKNILLDDLEKSMNLFDKVHNKCDLDTLILNEQYAMLGSQIMLH